MEDRFEQFNNDSVSLSMLNNEWIVDVQSRGIVFRGALLEARVYFFSECEYLSGIDAFGEDTFGL